MGTERVPQWLDAAAVEAALQSTKAPDAEELRTLLDKSLALQPLSMQETAVLLRAEKPEQVEAIFTAAREVKEKVYGDRLVLSAPLHISNYCDSDCQYCAFRHSNTVVERKQLTKDEIVNATMKLIRQGHKRVLLVAGEHWSKDGLPYVLDAAKTIYNTRFGNGEIRRININLPPLSSEEYAELKEADIGTCLIYQDTYHEESYKKAHPRGPKSNFARRLGATDVALKAGIGDVGFGILLGLGPWEFDLLSLVLHSAHMERIFDSGVRTVSMHRMRSVPGALWDQAPHPVSDEDYKRVVAITRLAIPHAGIILTTKEPSHMWRWGCDVGCSQLLTGSVANPYESWNMNLKDGEVGFPLGEYTHLDDIIHFLTEEADHLPSFCTACPRLGRSGSEFLEMVCSGGMQSQCGPNSIASFEEYLMGYATPFTKERGEEIIIKKLAQLGDQERGATERLLAKVRAGRVDEFI